MKRAIKSAINLAFKGVARTAPIGKFVWNNIFAHPMRFLGVLNASNARRSQSSSGSNNKDNGRSLDFFLKKEDLSPHSNQSANTHTNIKS